MPTVRLSDLGIQKLKSSEKHVDYFDVTLATFGVRVSPKGTKTFILKLRSGRQAIGRYPILSLSDARTEAKRILAERTLGRIRPRSITYSQAVKLFIEDKKRSRRESTAEQYEWFLGRFNFGQLADITHEDIERQLAKIGSKSTYDHVLVAARTFFNWCIRRRYVENNPTAGLSPHGTPQRSRVLTDEELGRIWRACEQRSKRETSHSCDGSNEPIHIPSATLPASFCTIVKLLILLGTRRGEIAALRWSWIKDDRIEWPPEVMKNGKSHWLPLLPLTKSIIEQVPTIGDLLFPARGKDTPFNGWSKSASQLWTLSGVEGATLHDIRRSWTTHNAAWAAPHILERALSHVSGTISGVAALYNRFQYEKELIDCYQQWERRIAAIVENGP